MAHHDRDELIHREWWSFEEAAFVLGVAESTIGRWIKAGMPARSGFNERGRRIYVLRADDVRGWSATRRTPDR